MDCYSPLGKRLFSIKRKNQYIKEDVVMSSRLTLVRDDYFNEIKSFFIQQDEKLNKDNRVALPISQRDFFHELFNSNCPEIRWVIENVFTMKNKFKDDFKKSIEKLRKVRAKHIIIAQKPSENEKTEFLEFFKSNISLTEVV
jgi:hypothetical protein